MLRIIELEFEILVLYILSGADGGMMCIRGNDLQEGSGEQLLEGVSRMIVPV